MCKDRTKKNLFFFKKSTSNMMHVYEQVEENLEKKSQNTCG